MVKHTHTHIAYKWQLILFSQRKSFHASLDNDLSSSKGKTLIKQILMKITKSLLRHEWIISSYKFEESGLGVENRLLQWTTLSKMSLFIQCFMHLIFWIYMRIFWSPTWGKIGSSCGISMYVTCSGKLDTDVIQFAINCEVLRRWTSK